MGLIAKLALALALGAGHVAAPEGRGGHAYSALSSHRGGAWQEGQAVRYAPNRMERTAAIRGIPWQPCMVAWTYAKDADMGKVWLEVEGVKTGIRKTCLVVDLPETIDRPNLIKRGIIVELGYTNRDICPPGWDGAARLCKVRVRIV